MKPDKKPPAPPAAKAEKSFPVHPHALRFGGPATIPFAWLEQHREAAEKNHGHTLERLAERGGLSWGELRWAAGGPYPGNTNDEPAARVFVVKDLLRWKAEQRKA